MPITTKADINFLIYDNRSGSTFLSALLDNFVEIGVSLKSPILYYFLTGKRIYRSSSEIDHALKHIYKDRKFNEWNVSEKQLRSRLIDNLPLTMENFFYFILDNYFHRSKPNAKSWIYKTGNPYLIKRIKKTFHNAKFIFIYRDGRAVYSSKKKSFSRNVGDVMEKDPIRAAKIWSRHFKLINKLENDFDIIKIRYEDLVGNTEKELKRLYRFIIGNEFSNRILKMDPSSYFKKIPDSQLHLHSNVSAKPLKSRIDGWKNELSYNEGYLYEKKANSTLKEMDYEIYYSNKLNSYRYSKEMYMFSLKLFFKRNIRQFSKVLFFVFRPKFIWKKLAIRFEAML